jgi:hypothetical protein
VNGKWSYVIGALLLIPTLFGGCRPKYAPAAHVSDGTVVLLRRGVTNAAFVVTKQSASPEVVDYTWYLRWDGKTTFESNNPASLTGSVKGAKSIAFGPFDINWSTAGSEGGWLYYPGEPRSVIMPWGNYYTFRLPGGTAMAVTTERDITTVDAKDPRWDFKK